MIKAVLFDVDGVLIDSLKANWVFFSDAMRRNGYKVPSLAEYRKVFHLPLADALAALSKEKDKKKLKELTNSAMNYRKTDYQIRLIGTPAGAREIIRAMSKSYRLGIVTSRLLGVRKMVASIYRGDYFSPVITRKDYKRRKPSPESLLVAAERLRIRPREIVYVGDAETDILAAHAAGMKAIGFSRKRLKGADAMAASFSSIPKIIAGLNKT